MWIIIILMLIGVLAGFLFSGVKYFNVFSERATSYIIYFLLFFMGLSVGTNKEIMNNIQNIGFQALIITIFSIAGSIVLAAIVFKIFFKNES
ncbi:MAG: LysO family transporter [Bacteroidales bacterium]|nr:LysO family transporter [Bacteroidales bacterium]